MLLQDVVEEITEKVDGSISIQSIIRKVTNVRDRLMRDYGPAQRRQTVCTGIDLIMGNAQYMIPCPAGNIVDVAIFQTHDNMLNGRWLQIPHKQFDREATGPYYYFLEGVIGIEPVPERSVPTGMKIFHVPVLNTLTVADLEQPTGFDPDYDMLLVYGVLRDMTTGSASGEFDLRYQQLLQDYRRTSLGFSGQIRLESW